MLDPFFNTLPIFAMFFAVGFALLALFATVYVHVTPYNELRLICEGNVAAAVSLSGAMLGMVMPIAVAVVASHSLVLMLTWASVACSIQLLVYLVARMLLPSMTADIPAGKVSVGILLAALSVCVGIINAACIL